MSGPIKASRGDDVGELVLWRKAWVPDELYIVRADPRIKIHAEIIKEIQFAMRVDDQSDASIRDGVVRIKAANRTVVYRLGDYIPDENAYYAEWPD